MLNLRRIQVVIPIACFYSMQTFNCVALAADASSEFERSFSAGIKAFQEGKAAEGEKLLKDTLKMEEKQGADEMKRSQSVMALADFYRTQKRYAEAEALYKQLIAKFDNGPNAKLIPAILNKLAGLYKTERKFPESLATYKHSLEIVEKQNGSDSAEAATVHANLGLLFQKHGQKRKKLKKKKRQHLIISKPSLVTQAPKQRSA